MFYIFFDLQVAKKIVSLHCKTGAKKVFSKGCNGQHYKAIGCLQGGSTRVSNSIMSLFTDAARCGDHHDDMSSLC